MTSNFIMFAVYKVVFSQGYDSNTAQCCGKRREKKPKTTGEKRVRKKKER